MISSCSMLVLVIDLQIIWYISGLSVVMSSRVSSICIGSVNCWGVVYQMRVVMVSGMFSVFSRVCGNSVVWFVCKSCVVCMLVVYMVSISSSYSGLGCWFCCSMVRVSVLQVMNFFCGMKRMWVIVKISIRVMVIKLQMMLLVRLFRVRMVVMEEFMFWVWCRKCQVGKWWCKLEILCCCVDRIGGLWIDCFLVVVLDGQYDVCIVIQFEVIFG